MHKGPQCQSSAPLCPLTHKNMFWTSVTESHDICIFLHSYLLLNSLLIIWLLFINLFMYWSIYILFFTCHLLLGICMLHREVATAWKSGWNNLSIFKSENNFDRYGLNSRTPRFGLGGGGWRKSLSYPHACHIRRLKWGLTLELSRRSGFDRFACLGLITACVFVVSSHRTAR